MGVAAFIVWVVHISIVLFMVLVPFLSVAWPIRLLHFVSGLTIGIHWLCHNDICFLTLLESQLRGVDYDKSFMYRIIHPIYNISDQQAKQVAYIGLPVLMAVNLMRLYAQRKDIVEDYHRLRAKKLERGIPAV